MVLSQVQSKKAYVRAAYPKLTTHVTPKVIMQPGLPCGQMLKCAHYHHLMVHLMSHNVWHRGRCVLMASLWCNVTHFHWRSWWMCQGLTQAPTVMLAHEQWAHYFEAHEWKRSNWARLEWTTKVDYAISNCQCTWSILIDILTRCIVSCCANKHSGWAIAQ